ncbi:hypothetical protein QTP70_002239, partial [Hemibagrus guttatus]
EDSFELHSVDLELEAVEKQIRDLQVKQAQLRQRKAALESSRTDAHLSQVNSRRETITPTTSTPCASLPRPSARTRPAQVSFTPAPGYHAAWMQQQRKTRAKPRARTSPPPPPPVFEISTQNRFAPLRETECDTVIIGDSIVRHVRATAAKGKVHTRCLPGARVLDVSAQVPAILKKNIGAVVLHAGTNDIRLRQTEILKKDFRSLVELVRTTSPTTRIIVSGPLPTFQRGIESDDITDHHLLVYTLPVEHIRHVSPRYRLGEDSFELHSVDLELEAVEKQIRDLQVKQAQLRQRKAALESSRTDAHLSQAQRKDAARPGFVHSGAGVPRSLDAAAAEDASQAPGEDLSPSAATRLRDPDPEPLRSPSRDGVRHGDHRRLHRSARPCYCG